MNKPNFTESQKQRLKVSSFFGIAGLISMIIVVICSMLAISKSKKLDDAKYIFNIAELEDAISACTIVGIVFAIVMVVCIGVSLYILNITNKEIKQSNLEIKK